MKHEQRWSNIKALSESFFEVQTISSAYFLSLQIMYKAGEYDLEKFINYALDVKTINPKDFESLEDFFDMYDDQCISALANDDEIEQEIINPIKNMEDNYGSWEALRSEGFSDDQYNLEKGN